MTEEVKSCPFCGGKEVKLFKEGSIWVVECLQCLAKVGATAEADALDFWNYRQKEKQLCEQIREMKQKNEALKREILEAREDNEDNMEYHVAERERLKKEIEELRGCVSFAERMRILELLKSCCNEFVPLYKRTSPNYPVCYRNRLVIGRDGHCTARGECPIYAELTKGAGNDKRRLD